MQVVLTEKLWKLINDVQITLGNKITYTPDKTQYKVAEKWADGRNTWLGDCEDYALAKYNALKEEGFPQECMGIATCDVDGDGKVDHAVLIVSTDQGDYVLDNRFVFVMPYKACKYKWVYIPSYLKGSN